MPGKETLFGVNGQRHLRHLRRIIRGPGTLASVAYEREVLCPEEPTDYLPVFYLDNQLERVTGSSEWSTKENEIAIMTKMRGTNGPTFAYHIRDATLFDGSIYSDNLRYFVAEPQRFNRRSSEVESFDSCALVSSFYGMKYFGHWLRDDCSFQHLASELCLRPLCLPVSPAPHVAQYKSLFGQIYQPVVRARIRDLVIFEEHSQNSLRLKQYEALRARIAARFPRKGQERFIYLKRGKTGIPRVLENEDQVIEVLMKRGFSVVDVENDELHNIISTLVDAKVVISIEGSHIAHCTFAIPRNGGLLVLQPADRFAANHRLWTNCLGVQHGFVVGPVSEHSYIFDPKEIMRTLDLMMIGL
jgi:hypothetical protein